MAVKLKKQEMSLYDKDLHKRALKRSRKQFINSFDENIDHLSDQKKQPNTKLARNRMTYSKKICQRDDSPKKQT